MRRHQRQEHEAQGNWERFVQGESPMDWIREHRFGPDLAKGELVPPLEPVLADAYRIPADLSLRSEFRFSFLHATGRPWARLEFAPPLAPRTAGELTSAIGRLRACRSA